MKWEINSLPEAQQSAERRKRIQSLLDSGLGCCILRHDDCARIAEESLLFGDTDRYRLLAWCVMPNHVHVLIEQQPNWPLAKVVQSWKRHIAREIHRLGSPSCTQPSPDPLWQRDYWDRYIRNEQHLQAAKRYIEENPVAAGLVASAERWPWGSARFEELPSTTRRSQENRDV